MQTVFFSQLNNGLTFWIVCHINFFFLLCLSYICSHIGTNNINNKLPESHVDGQYFLDIVSGQLVGDVRVNDARFTVHILHHLVVLHPKNSVQSA